MFCEEVCFLKRLISVLLAVCLAVTLFAIQGSAEGEVFVAAGNTVLPLTDAMPIYSSGKWYIDYQCFTKGDLRVSSSYNAAEGTLVLYTWDTTLVFDIKSTTAYTTAEKVRYKATSFQAYGTVYVPVQFTAQTLGFQYSYFSEIPLIRIKRENDIPNSMFLYLAQSSASSLLAQYNASKNRKNVQQTQTNTPSKNNSSVSAPEDTKDNSVRKTVYLTFNIKNGSNMKKIIDSLSRYGYPATFFIQGSAVSNCEDEILRAAVYGHTLGSLSENGDSDFAMKDEDLKARLSSTNNALFEIAKQKTRLLRIPSGSTSVSPEKRDFLISCGYRLWDSDLNPKKTVKRATAQAYYNSVKGKLSARSSPAVLELDDDAVSVASLSRILRYLNSENYIVRQITLLDTPVNSASDKR